MRLYAIFFMVVYAVAANKLFRRGDHQFHLIHITSRNLILRLPKRGGRLTVVHLHTLHHLQLFLVQLRVQI